MVNHEVNRRDFLKQSLDTGARVAAASGLAASLPATAAEEKTRAESKTEICAYTEKFQSLPIPKVCRVFKEIGIDGLDVTVRPGGHIEPKDAPRELPKAARAARDVGLRIMMLTTGITASDSDAEGILATCKEIGVDRIKLGYYGPAKFGSLAKEIDNVKRQLERVVKLAEKYDVLPCVHVHSGLSIPSNGFMLYDVIRDIPPERIGAYVDSYHMTMTGGAGGWRQAIDLLTPWIALVALKTFQWERGKRDQLGQQEWRAKFCPLADGIAPIPEFVRTIQQVGYRGFFTLHTEYRFGVEECIRQTAADFRFLRRVLG